MGPWGSGRTLSFLYINWKSASVKITPPCGETWRPHASPPRIITCRSRKNWPPALVLVGSDGQDTRAIHGSSRSAMVHPSAFVLNGRRLVVVATLGWRNGTLLSTRSYACKRNIVFNLGEMSCFNQHNAVEFEQHFICTRKGVHVCFIISPGKMIFAVLELWLSPL